MLVEEEKSLKKRKPRVKSDLKINIITLEFKLS